MKLNFSEEDVDYFFGLISFKEKFSGSLGLIEAKQLNKFKDQFGFFKKFGRFNFSRVDIDALLVLIEFRRKFVKRPSVGELDRLFNLRDVLLSFRKSVWGDIVKEV